MTPARAPAAAPVGTVREEPPSPPAGAQRRVVLALSYDGAAFHGFAAQPRQRTVQGRIEEALAQITGGAVDSVCAGRTDAGVHALAQVLHVDLDAAYFARRQVGEEPFTEAPALARSLNKMLAPEVTVWRCFTAPEGFDARHSATARRYRYVIETGPRRDPLYRGACWHLPGELDLPAMRLATEAVHGEHDFSAFCRQPKGREAGPLRRRVSEARWRTEAPLLVLEIEANAFCHQMVRSLVGMLVAIGQGRRQAAEVHERLRNPDRDGLPQPAPAEGLCLVAVQYPEALGGRFA